MVPLVLFVYHENFSCFPLSTLNTTQKAVFTQFIVLHLDSLSIVLPSHLY